MITIYCNKSYVNGVSLKVSYCILVIFLLKEALYGFFLAYPNCQHHCSYALGPLLSKIRAT